MVGIIEGIEEIFVKWVDVLKPRKAIEYGLKLFAERFGCELDFTSIEAC